MFRLGFQLWRVEKLAVQSTLMGRYIYIAGTYWLTGQSPYNFDTLSRV
jgi:hypothetical protein